MNQYLSLFLTGFVQVLLVALNTYQIAHEKYLGVLIIGFLISYIWTWNVKKIAFGNRLDRATYAAGAAAGACVGLYLAKIVYLTT